VSRVFGVGFEVPAPYGDHLHALRLRLGDPSARLMPPHVTLLPPTRVTDDAFVEVVLHLEQVARSSSSFEVRLRGAATFRPVTPTVFVPLAAGLDSCQRVEKLVRTGPLRRRLPFPYHPHVTVAYELPDEVLDAAMTELDGFVADFVVDAFGLYEADDAGVWQSVQRFALTATSREGD
jgi:2'-5' RNA ligase